MVVEDDEETILLVDSVATRPKGERAGSIRTLVAMPAYNEEAYIAKTVLGARQHADRVLVVDDGSQDETVPIAEALGAIVVRHTTNKGYGGALQTIFSTARDLGAEELVIIDSDGQHSPGDISRLLTELRRGNDVVIGSRFVEGSAGDIPAYRKVGMKVLDTATTLAGNNLAITDSQSGFRAYGRKAIEAIHISGEGMSAGSEILIQISDHRLKVAEVPIRVRYDIEGTSSENPVSHGVGVLMNIVRLISLRRPLVFFGIPGRSLRLPARCGDLHLLRVLSERPVPLYRLHRRVLDVDPRAAARDGGDHSVLARADYAGTEEWGKDKFRRCGRVPGRTGGREG